MTNAEHSVSPTTIENVPIGMLMFLRIGGLTNWTPEIDNMNISILDI